MEGHCYKPLIAQNKRKTKNPTLINKLSKKDSVKYKIKIRNVIENSYSWIKQYPILCFQYQKNVQSYVGLLLLASSIILFNKIYKYNKLKTFKKLREAQLQKRRELNKKRMKKLKAIKEREKKLRNERKNNRCIIVKQINDYIKNNTCYLEHIKKLFVTPNMQDNNFYKEYFR